MRAPTVSRPLRLLMVGSGITGGGWMAGMRDPLAGLPRALRARGVHVQVVTAAGPDADWDALGAGPATSLALDTGRVRIRAARHDGVPVWIVVLDRPLDDGVPRSHERGTPELAADLAAFARAVLALARQLETRPDVVHCHAWHTALVPVLARARARTPAGVRTLLTIDDIARQGLFPPRVWPLFGLAWRYLTPRHLEFHGQVNLLKGALGCADALATVSPRYAREILTPEHGHGLDAVLRRRRRALAGVLHGIDDVRWDPARDAALAACYDAGDLAGKVRCKAALQASLGLRASPRTPLLAVGSALDTRAGTDLAIAALPDLLRLDLQLVFMGGDETREGRALVAASARAPGRLAVCLEADEQKARRLLGGADALLAPARDEPCDPWVMAGLRYGAVPIVRAVGGLADTVREFHGAAGNGITFHAATPDALVEAARRALLLYRRPAEWRHVLGAAMRSDVSWRRTAAGYLEIYRRLNPRRLGGRRRGPLAASNGPRGNFVPARSSQRR